MIPPPFLAGGILFGPRNTAWRKKARMFGRLRKTVLHWKQVIRPYFSSLLAHDCAFFFHVSD